MHMEKFLHHGILLLNTPSAKAVSSINPFIWAALTTWSIPHLLVASLFDTLQVFFPGLHSFDQSPSDILCRLDLNNESKRSDQEKSTAAEKSKLLSHT